MPSLWRKTKSQCEKSKAKDGIQGTQSSDERGRRAGASVHTVESMLRVGDGVRCRELSVEKLKSGEK
jgi:hypothetical protein